MAPADFVKFVDGIGERVAFLRRRFWEGSLPNPLEGEPKEEAMAKAEALVRSIMRLGSPRSTWMPACTLEEMGAGCSLDPTLIAERTARLCQPWRKGTGNVCLCAPCSTACIHHWHRCRCPWWLYERKRRNERDSPRRLSRHSSPYREAFSRHGLEAAWPQVVELWSSQGWNLAMTSFKSTTGRKHDSATLEYPGLVFEGIPH